MEHSLVVIVISNVLAATLACFISNKCGNGEINQNLRKFKRI